jgi:acetylornithine deacetylase/succinyl-diaminopimelate desuccinylase-like protein
VREGGSIPIVTTFKEILGSNSILLPMGLPDENTHSPNENFYLPNFFAGIKTAAYLFEELAIT